VPVNRIEKEVDELIFDYLRDQRQAAKSN
jgi:hypothetical protein